MNFPSLSCFGGAVLCWILAAVAFWVKRGLLPWQFFGLGMVLLAADDALAGLILQAESPQQLVLWQNLRLMIIALIPGTWLVFSLSYSRGNHREFLKRWRVLLLLAYAIPLLAVCVQGWRAVEAVPVKLTVGDVFVGLGLPGKIVNLVLLVGSVLILVNLERTFRSAVGIMRWRIKYFILGVALLFGVKLYTSSQALLYGGVHGIALQINAAAVIVAALLTGYSLLRTKLAESEIYPSHQVLQHSFTAVVAGIYLVGVGLLADVVKKLGGDSSFPIKALMLMAVVVGLTVVVFSDRVRQRISLFVSRNFRRPVHDYRKVWSALTERTASMIDHTELCRALVKAVSDTFDLLSVTLWRVSEHDRGLLFGASTSFTEEKAGALLVDARRIAELVEGVRGRSVPFDIDQCQEKWIGALKELNPDMFNKGGRRVCVPLVSGGELVGLITVADRVNGLGFSTEDLDLLKCIGDQAAGSLRNIQLSQKLMQAREMEAFQTMSAFFVHDLKNTASSLSLMLQNLPAQMENPSFRQDALRTVSNALGKLNDVIARLGLLREKVQMTRVQSDLNQVVKLVLDSVVMTPEVSIVRSLNSLPQILIDPDQVQKVLTNLLINAREAVRGKGDIRVETSSDGNWAVLSVQDNGCGMSQEFVSRSLFRPFQTTKKNGIGIGMFHCKTIVEAHQGRIEAESHLGRGTTFRVLFPMGGVSA